MAREFLADNGRPMLAVGGLGGIAYALADLLSLWLDPLVVMKILALLVAIAAALGFYIPRRSMRRKVELNATGRAPVDVLASLTREAARNEDDEAIKALQRLQDQLASGRL